MPCPNKNLDIWKQLVAALDGKEGDAMAAYVLNDYEIPSIEDARLLLKGSTLEQETDNSVKEELRAKKLERVDKQIQTLDRIIKSAPKDKRQETLNKLKENLAAYRTIVENDEATVSVSNLFAGGEIENLENYKNYAEFGTFMHFVVEMLQLETLGTSKSMTGVLTREKLKDFLKEFKATREEGFSIKGLVENGEIVSVEEMYNMLQEILGVVQNYTFMGYTLLPEVTIASKDRYGRNIVGRLDMLAIDKNGSAAVLDLKSKKMKSTSVVDSLGYYYRVNGSKFTDSQFVGGTRNTYENWDVQLGIYARMLQQLDINTSEKRIISLQYYGSYSGPDGRQFTEKGEDTFDYQFYKVKNYNSSEFDKASEMEVLRYKQNMKKIRKVIPVEDVTDEKMFADKPAMENIFNLSDEEAKKLVGELETIAEREIKETERLLKNARDNSDKSTIKFYEDRRESLRKMQDALKKDVWEAPYKVGIVVQKLLIDSKSLLERANTVNINLNVETISEKNKAIAELGKELEQLYVISTGFNQVINQLRSLLIGSGVALDSAGIRTINDILNNIDSVKSVYNQYGFRNMVYMLSISLGDFQLQRVNEQRKQRLQEEINYLKRKKDDLLKSDKKASLWHRISNPLANVARSATGSNVLSNNELEAIEIQIEKLELEMQGVSLEESDIRKFIEGISDPDSPMYIGQNTTFFTPFIASSSSADWVLSSYAAQLKIAIANGSKEYVNFVEREKLQQEFGKYAAGNRDVIKLNERIGEVRYELQYDDDGNETKVERRAYVTPFKQEYYDIFDRHTNAIYQLNKKIRNENDEIKKKELQKQKSDLIKKHQEWRLQNTEMRYLPEFYKLDKFLPEEYKVRRDELYAEKSLLESSAGFNNAEDLDPDTLREIAQIEVELQKLKKQYSDMGGGYSEYIKKQEEYFDYEVNWNYFNRLYNQKLSDLTDPVTGMVDTEALARWKKQNMIRRPKQEWYNRISEIWENVYMILGRPNPEITELRDKHREILSQYRRRGAVDSRFITKEDMNTLSTIDLMIEAYKSGNERNALSREEREYLTELFNELQGMQTKIENPYYMEEFDRRVEDLDLAWSRYQNEESPAEKDRLLNQFVLTELDFKTWYDNNHTNEYVSKLVSNEAMTPLPKNFNMLSIPTDDAMMEEIPDYKYSIRNVKPTMLNLDYQEDAMGYPVPKGISMDNARAIGNSPWLNTKYQAIRNNPRDDEFYHSFVGRYLTFQKETIGARILGYNFPGYEEKSLQDIQENGVLGGIKNRAQIFKDQNLTTGNPYDFSINGYKSKQDDKVVFRHNTPLPINQQTRDGISAVIRWYEEAHINKAMAAAQVSSKAMIDYLENQYDQLSDRKDIRDADRRKQGLRRVIDQIRFEYDKFIKGEWKKDQGLAGRVGDLVLRGMSITRLGLDIPNQIGNMLSGNVQAFLGGHKSGLYSSKNLLWAKSKIYGKDGLIGSFIRDFDKIGQKSFMTKMYLYWNPRGENFDEYYDKTRTTGERLGQGFLEGKFAMDLQDKGEIEISSSVWLSIMDNIKIKLVKTWGEDGKAKEYVKDENGNIKTINVFEAYTENENGEIVIRPDAEWSRKDEYAVQKMVWSEVRRTQGRYSDYDKAFVESGFGGRLLLYYRKYLEPSLRNRFGRGETNWEAGEEAMGMYVGLIKALRYYTLRQFFSGLFGGKGMNEFYQKKSQMAAREIATAIAMYIMGRMMLAALPDDDEDDMTFGTTVLYNMAAVYAKVDTETRSLVPMIVVGGFQNYMENLSSFTNAGRDVSRIFSLMDHGFFLGLSTVVDKHSDFGRYVNKHAYYQRNTKLFDKGDAKIKKDIMGLTGYMNFYELFNPQERINNYRSRIN